MVLVKISSFMVFCIRIGYNIEYSKRSVSNQTVTFMHIIHLVGGDNYEGYKGKHCSSYIICCVCVHR